MPRTARPVTRSFGTPFYWTRESGTQWTFEDGWGTHRLTYYRRSAADRRPDTGWYLSHPDDGGWDEYMGPTITAAASSEETQTILTSGLRRWKTT